MKLRSLVVGLIGLLVFVSCSENNEHTILLDTYPLSISEPSGLSYSADKQSLYTVSDRGTIYSLSFDGKSIQKLSYTSDDFEGVTVNIKNSGIYVVKERSGELVELDVNGRYKKTYSIINNPGNSGLEGVSYDSKRNLFYLLKEKDKGLLITYSLSEGITDETELGFASDYSGIFYNENTDKLWIVSDESNTLTRCDLKGNSEIYYDLTNLQGIEGVVVNEDETEAFIVSDPSNKIYKINLLR
ncbi:MAG: SdiA-regulated domain-containing protein [Bacteroidota bacterium]